MLKKAVCFWENNRQIRLKKRKFADMGAVLHCCMRLVLNIFINASAEESEVFYLTGDLVSAIRLQGII